MAKRKKWIKRKDGHRQRYTIGRKRKRRNYSHNPLLYYADPWDKTIYSRITHEKGPATEQKDYSKYESHGIHPKNIDKLLQKVKKGRRRRYTEADYRMARTAIKHTRDQSIQFAKQHGRIRYKLDWRPKIKDQEILKDKMHDFRKRISENSEKIDMLNKKYFPKNPS